MSRRTEKKFSAQLLADYAEDHARVKNIIALMLSKRDYGFSLDFNDKHLENLLKALSYEFKDLNVEVKQLKSKLNCTIGG